MYDQIRGDTLYIMLYAVVTAMSIMASCYLLFRQGNAFARDITTPLRLRRLTAVFFAFFALNHAWYMPIFFITSSEDIKMIDLIGGLLDCMTTLPLAIIVLLAMLQDRRRQLWPVAVMFAPLIVGNAMCVATRSYDLVPLLYLYALLVCIGFIIYMVRETRRYGRWLRDNYADLEHKEVWQSLVVLAIILLAFVTYALASNDPAYQYSMQVISIVLICYLLWRVETLSDLSIPDNDTSEETVATEHEKDNALALSVRNNIEPMLKQYCEEQQLYLEYDLTLSQLVQKIGTNRLYLSQYFSSQGTTYNTYINGLRIQHFINKYHEAATAHQPITAQKLALQSGFRNYNTFGVAFKKIMGMTATEWMRNDSECGHLQN